MNERLPTGEHIEILFGVDEIAARIGSLAEEIAAAKFDNLLLVPILKGSFIFASDLMRALHEVGVHPQVDFLFLSSYREATRSSGHVEVLRGIEGDLKGRDVLLVDDILDSGRTLAFAKDYISALGAKRVATCILLDKPIERAAEIEADFRGFECPDVFVVGYGMDLADRFRELPYIGRIV